jgi:hypothetical protein
VNALITTFGLTLAVAASTVGVSAQTATTTAVTSTSSAPRTQQALVVQPKDTYTVLGYQNADPLHGMYTRKPMTPQCGTIMVGPMASAAPGSMEAQPLANFLTDFDMVGIACRTHGL